MADISQSADIQPTIKYEDNCAMNMMQFRAPPYHQVLATLAGNIAAHCRNFVTDTTQFKCTSMLLLVILLLLGCRLPLWCLEVLECFC